MKSFDISNINNWVLTQTIGGLDQGFLRFWPDDDTLIAWGGHWAATYQMIDIYGGSMVLKCKVNTGGNNYQAGRNGKYIYPANAYSQNRRINIGNPSSCSTENFGSFSGGGIYVTKTGKIVHHGGYQNPQKITIYNQQNQLTGQLITGEIAAWYVLPDDYAIIRTTLSPTVIYDISNGTFVEETLFNKSPLGFTHNDNYLIIYYNNKFEFYNRYASSELSVTADTNVVCNNHSTHIRIHNSQQNISYQLMNNSNAVGEPQVGNGGTVSINTGNLSQPTEFTVTASDISTGCSITLDTTIMISVLNESFVLDLPDLIEGQCGLDSLVLDAGLGFSSYLWNTGETTRQITVNESGNYKVVVTGCFEGSDEDSTFVSLIKAQISQNDTSICTGQSLQLSVQLSNVPSNVPGFGNINVSLGHTYFVSNNALTWSQAKTTCQSNGGHLVTISDFQENEFVKSLHPGTNLWIGLTDELQEGSFKWVSNEPFAYSRWSPGEPNNTANEDYTEMYSGGYWNDAQTNNTRRFVLEFDEEYDYYSYLWSTGATTPSITVTPTQTTTYYCTISNGIHSCMDSVTLTVLPPISIQAKDLVFNNVASNQFAFNWTDGNGNARAAFIKMNSTGTAVPVNNTTYFASTTFGAGSQIGSTGWYCVFNGTEHPNGVTVTGLQANTDYLVMVCEYIGTPGTEQYNVSSSSNNPIHQNTYSFLIDRYYSFNVNRSDLGNYPENKLYPNQWYNIVVTRSNVTHIGELYINGVLKNSVPWGYEPYNLSTLIVGYSNYGGPNSYYNGYLDEFRISNNVRCASEISLNYTENNPYVIDANTVALWHFDETTGTSVNNSVNAVNGTLYNGVTFQNGKFGNSIKFDGQNDYANLNFNIPDAIITTEYWIKFDTIMSSGQIIVYPYGSYITEHSLNPHTDTIYQQGCTFTTIISVNGPTTFCEGNSVVLTSVHQGNPYTFQWLIDGSPISGAINSEFLANFSGNYSVVVDSLGCVDTSNIISVIVNPLPTVSCPENITAFVNDEPYELNMAMPSGGIYSGNGVLNGFFDPLVAGEGSHVVTYNFEDNNNCENNCTFTITVIDIPETICPNSFETCSNQPIFQLTGGEPAGGVYSGNGVYFNEYFDPATVGTGEHQITYSYSESGYTSSCSFNINVVEPPTVTCPEDFAVCLNAGIIELNQAAPAGGWYEGNGVFFDLFNPLDAGLGDHLITYYYTASEWCQNSCTFTLSVVESPEMNCPAGFSVCISEPEFTLGGAEPAGGLYNINGNAGNVFDPETLGAGSHLVEYLYEIEGCSGMCSYTIEVIPLPLVDLGPDHSLLCNDFENNTPLPYQLMYNVPQYNSLQWTTSGTGWLSNPGIPNPVYHFSEEDIQTGQVTFTLTVEPEGICSVTVSDELTVFLPSQLIDIPAGWSGISSFIIPDNPNIVQVTAPCLENIIVQISIGGLYWPEQNVNTLYSWNANTGYKVKYEQTCCMPLAGTPVNLPSTVHLNVGTNYFPVHSQVPIKLTDLFGADTSKIITMVDIHTLQIYSPGFGVLNSLEYLEPGVGYLTYMSQSRNITYPVPDKNMSANITLKKREPYKVANHTSWNDVINTGSFHLISVEKSALSIFEPGDYLGAFIRNGNCVGMVEFKNIERLILPVFGDDPYTSEQEGFKENEYLSFKLYRNSSGEESDLNVVFDPSMPNHYGLFAGYGLSSIIALNTGAMSVGDIYSDKVTIFPNPAFELLTVVSSYGLKSIKLQNMISQTIYTAITDGSLRHEIDVSKYPEGVYFISVESENGSITTLRVVIQ